MEKKAASLKEQIAYVTPLVEDLKLKKEERVEQFVELKAQIDKITAEVSGYGHLINAASSLNLEEQDLSLRKLTEYQTELQTLQKEKVCLSMLFPVVLILAYNERQYIFASDISFWVNGNCFPYDLNVSDS